MSLPIAPTPFRVEKELQIAKFSPFQLPADWVVEERPRPSNPSHIDRYYYEPGTGKKFRSLLSVQRHLENEKADYLITERMVSTAENTTCIESGTRQDNVSTKKSARRQDGISKKESSTRQRFHSLRAVENFLAGENACAATPKSVVKSGTVQRSRSGRSCQKPAHKYSSYEEANITPKGLKHSTQSTNTDSQKKIKLGKVNRASMHNLTAPPAKVSWVLSGPGGFWSPFLDDSSVQESEKLKWSEAFVLSIHDGVNS
ncbi:hypothetical protein RJT34_28475 [Clitoria ternatea]|uniref:MBD domain-containing protein n=1 Tax=Clitoria ternatea TaxID=43366 RepID=A0AAN9FHP6_CLITE